MTTGTIVNRMFAPVVCAAFVGCGADAPSPVDPGSPPAGGNIAPAISPIPNQVVLRNTIAPRTLTLDLGIADPDNDTITVRVTSADESVVAPRTFECSPGSCTIVLTPAADRTAAVTIDVAATDAAGARATATFRLDVVPRFVTSATDNGPGSLRSVVADSEAGDVVAFDTAGAFVTSRTVELQDQIVLDRVLAIEGPGADRLTLDGGGATRVFRVGNGAEVTVRDVTIANGRAPSETFEIDGADVNLNIGGGILIDEAKLTLIGSVVRDSRADHDGGGIHVMKQGTLVVENSVIDSNTAFRNGGGIGNDGTLQIVGTTVIRGNLADGLGGGVHSGTGATATIRDAAIEENTAHAGGGGMANIGVMSVTGSRIALNDTPECGGGFYQHRESPADSMSSLIEGTTIEFNSADCGGGVANLGGEIAIRGGSAISMNAGGSAGGGIFTVKVPHRDAHPTTLVEASTVAGNASTNGAGVYNLNGAIAIRLGAVVAGNEAGSLGGGIYSDAPGFEVVIESSAIGSDTAGGNKAITGGGIYIVAGLVDLIDSTVQHNTVQGRGGGVFNDQAGSLIVHPATLVTANATTQNRPNGAGIYNVGTLQNFGEVRDNDPDDIINARVK